MTLNYVLLTLDLYDGSGVIPPTGTAVFTPSATLTDAGTEITGQMPVTVPFTGTVLPQARLLATDNASVLPAGWAWHVSFPGITGAPAPFSFFLPAGAGAAQVLSAQVPVSAVTQFTAYTPMPVTTATFLAQPAANRVVAHRGLPQVAPEHTMTAYRAAVEAMLSQGLVPAVKLDVYQLGDLSLGVMHDGTVDRTTTSSGPVGNYGAQSWKTLLANGAQTGPAWTALQTPVPLLSEVLDKLGGKCVFVIESKSTNPAGVNAVIAEVTARRLAGSVILTGEDTTLTLPGLAQAAGIPWWYYWLANPISSPVTPAQAAATAGITALGAELSQGASYADADITTIVTAAHTAGLLATGFTYIRRYDYQRALSFGVDVHAVNDLYTVTSTQDYLSDRFFTGAPIPGEVGSTTPAGQSASAPSYSYAGSTGHYRRQMTPAEGLGGIFEALGFACPVPSPANSVWTFTGTVFWDAAETSTTDGATWAGILICAPDDRFFDGNAHCSGYQCAIRQGNGSTYAVPTLQIYKQIPGAYQNNGSYATGSGVNIGGNRGSTTGFAGPNTLNASYPAGTPVTSLTLGSTVSIPAGMQIALPNGQIATVSSPVTTSVTVPITSLTPTLAWSSGAAVSFGVPFSVQVTTTTPGQTSIVFKRTDTSDTLSVTDTNTGGTGPYAGGYVHIGKAGTGSAGSTLTLSFAGLTIT